MGVPEVNGWRWRVVGLLFLATVLNYLDRQTLSVCAPLVRDEFGLSNAQYGELLSAFRWTYAAVMVPAGLLADRVAVRWLYPLAVLVWSLAGASAAFVRTAGGLTATRAALGVGEAFNWPCGLRVTANLLTDKDRSLANGLFQSGTAVGALTAPLIVGPVAVHFGWRAAFLLVGALGVVWAAAWLVVTRGRPIDVPRSTGPAQSLVGLLLDRRFWLLAVAAALINPCLYFLAEWLPNYLNSHRGFGVIGAGLATVPVFIGADLGNVGGGWLVRNRMARGWTLTNARGMAVGVGALLAACAIPAEATADPYLCVLLLGLAGAGVGAVMANWLTCIQELSRAGVGRSMGLLGAVGCVAGATLNPLIGRHVDATGRYDLPFLLVGLAPAATVAALVLFDLTGPRDDRPDRPL